jgi:hypothetical protein
MIATDEYDHDRRRRPASPKNANSKVYDDDGVSEWTSSSSSSYCPNGRCRTCGAVDVDVEMDVDNPGDYYCVACWDEYDASAALSSSFPPLEADVNDEFK